jgi:hypothetical protein
MAGTELIQRQREILCAFRQAVVQLTTSVNEANQRHQSEAALAELTLKQALEADSKQLRELMALEQQVKDALIQAKLSNLLEDIRPSPPADLANLDPVQELDSSIAAAERYRDQVVEILCAFQTSTEST